jgi:hypothetical protein
LSPSRIAKASNISEYFYLPDTMRHAIGVWCLASIPI